MLNATDCLVGRKTSFQTMPQPAGHPTDGHRAPSTYSWQNPKRLFVYFCIM